MTSKGPFQHKLFYAFLYIYIYMYIYIKIYNLFMSFFAKLMWNKGKRKHEVLKQQI